MTKGSCLCGDVTFETKAQPLEPTMCHCGQCQRQAGAPWASAHVANDDLTISGPVNWYASSAQAERGSCPRCGSFLFWRDEDEGTTSFSLGAIAQPSGLKITKHIFVADKGDYYDIADGVPQED